MPFNFRAHHSHRHCSGCLLYSQGKCSGEEVGGNGEVAGDYWKTWSVESKHVDGMCVLSGDCRVPWWAQNQERDI